MEPIEKLAAEWLRLDPEYDTRQEIQVLLDNDNREELERRLRGRIAFGTAGLRARMEAGFTRFNTLTVIQTTQGLARYLLAAVPHAKQQGVVVGYDARHNSKKFATVTRHCLMNFGFKVYWFTETVHTPLVPFAIDLERAVAGVMITASHNPKNYNGYKVYWSNGVQILYPHDQGIAAAIEQDLEVVAIDLQDPDSPFTEPLSDVTVRMLYEATVRTLVQSEFPSPRFVYTPMHGVGHRPFADVLKGLPAKTPLEWTVVSEQVDPDPEFPTVEFPHLYEAGALDLAKKTADSQENSFDFIIANNPDADRLAVAQRLTASELFQEERLDLVPGWHQFTGNELGVLLAAHVIEEAPRTHPNKTLAFITSTVSTQMLQIMVEKVGYGFGETLSGFNWLSNEARRYEASGYTVPFAFEAELGFMFPDVVHDKDGIAAALVFLHAAAKWKNEQTLSPWRKLQALYKQHGYFVEANTYLISPSVEVTNRIFTDIRKRGPRLVGTFQISRWRDLTFGFDTAGVNMQPNLPTDPNSHMITCELHHKVRSTVRASGTAQKIQIYVECRNKKREEAERLAKAARRSIVEEWFNPQKYGLE